MFYKAYPGVATYYINFADFRSQLFPLHSINVTGILFLWEFRKSAAYSERLLVLKLLK